MPASRTGPHLQFEAKSDTLQLSPCLRPHVSSPLARPPTSIAAAAAVATPSSPRPILVTSPSYTAPTPLPNAYQTPIKRQNSRAVSPPLFRSLVDPQHRQDQQQLEASTSDNPDPNRLSSSSIHHDLQTFSFNPSNDNPNPTPQPRYAEELTPARRRKHHHRHSRTPAPTSNDAATSGRQEFYDAEGDLYRGPGPSTIPTPQRFRYDTSGRMLDEDALSLRSFSSRGSSSSSSTGRWSAVVDAFEAVGQALGVLSDSSGSSSSSSSSDEDGRRSSMSVAAGGRRRKSTKRPKKKRGRAMSFGSWMGGRSSAGGSDSSDDDEPLGRRKIMGKREFVLMLPPSPALDPPKPTFLSPSTVDPIPPSLSRPPQPLDSLESRTIKTPYLPKILQAIQDARTPVLQSPPSSSAAPEPSVSSKPGKPPRPKALSQIATLAPMTPRQLLNLAPSAPSNPPTPFASNIPLTTPQPPTPAHRPSSRRPPVPHPKVRTFKPPSIPLPSSVLHAPFPTPLPSPGTAGAPPGGAGSYFGTVPSVIVEGATPATTPPLAAVGGGGVAGGSVSQPSGGSGGGKPVVEEPATTAWWLDVHCPGWEDMRALGELLSLHPLTLEDILHQDPREKLEVFDRLGYYLISFRAIDESYFRWTDDASPSPFSSPLLQPTPSNNSTTAANPPSPSPFNPLTRVFSKNAPSVRTVVGQLLPAHDPTLGATNPSLPGNPSSEPVLIDSGTGARVAEKEGGGRRKGRRRGKVEIVEDRPGKEGLEGVGVGAVNVYLVVFKDGIISFHFDDISKHVQNVRDRMLSLEEGRTLSSDWIAHGLMDSIVDSFFPLIGYVEDEADAIDSEIVHHDSLVDLPKAALVAAVPDSPSRRNVFLPQAGALMPSSNAMDDSIELAGERGQRDEVVELERIRKKLGFDSASSSFEEKRREAYEMKEIRLRRSSSKVDVVIETPPLPNSSNPDLTTSFPPPKLHVFFLRVRSRLSYFSLKLFSQLLLFLNLHPVQRARRRRRKQLRFSSSSAGSVASSVSSYSSNGQGSNQDLHDRYRSRSAFDKALMLKRMTATRRLVTGLTRLLLPKSEVVGRLRKRANEVSYGGHWGVVGGDMGTYIGDVQDHILSMQGTLLHYDRILSQAQPAYVSHLRLNLFAAKSGTDKAILGLSIVSIGVIPMQVLCGMFSQNVEIPYRADDSVPDFGGVKVAWGVIFIGLFVVASGVYCIVRYFKWSAHRKWKLRRPD